MQRKTLLTIIIVLVVIAFFSWMYRLVPQKIVTQGAFKEINVEQITHKTSIIDAVGQQHMQLKTVFTYEGWYHGNHFVSIYDDEGIPTMRITEKMNPSDGVIEGFVLETIEDGKPYLSIFLDEDWKQQLPGTQLYWGKTFQNRQLFDFTKRLESGVYMNKVADDMQRFENNYSLHYGGLYVGMLKDDGNSTVIKFN